MNDPGLFLDSALCLTLVILGWRILHSSDHFQAVVLFITFGLVIALSWVRLEAPDIAIAEAAVGAGLAGVLLLDTLRILKSTPAQETNEKWKAIDKLPFFHKAISFAVVSLLTCLLILAVLSIPRTGGGLAGLVNSTMNVSGTKHPVTAVLLNFRGYDTWLELGILFMAVLGILCIRRCPGLASVASPPRTNPILETLVKGMMPVLLLASGYLLWLGGFAPGGAFQAGVVLGAGFILLWMAGHPSLSILPAAAWRFMVILGFLSFLVMGTFSLFVNGVFLNYDRTLGTVQIFLLETAATISIGAILAGLMLALQPLKETSSCEEEIHDFDSSRVNISETQEE